MSDSVGRLLKAMRILNGLRQADLARRLGVSTATISLTESGRRIPGRRELARIIESLQAHDRPHDDGEAD